MTQAATTARADGAAIGNDRLLFGMIFGVLAFWLFAQTTLNIAPIMAADLGLETSVMNIAVSITALFSGIFIVVIGGLADWVGRVRVVQAGFVLGIIGALLVGLAPSGPLAAVLLMAGRICQGLSAACIMPASLALVKAYWEGAGRQRAVSLWSMGSWGGAGFAALFGGLVADSVGWRWIFVGCAVVSVIGMLMVRGTPESRITGGGGYRLDIKGIVTFMVAMPSRRWSPRAARWAGRARHPRRCSSSPSWSATSSSASSRATPLRSSTFASSATGPTPGPRCRTCSSTRWPGSSSWP